MAKKKLKMYKVSCYEFEAFSAEKEKWYLNK